MRVPKKREPRHLSVSKKRGGSKKNQRTLRLPPFAPERCTRARVRRRLRRGWRRSSPREEGAAVRRRTKRTTKRKKRQQPRSRSRALAAAVANPTSAAAEFRRLGIANNGTGAVACARGVTPRGQRDGGATTMRGVATPRARAEQLIGMRSSGEKNTKRSFLSLKS